jgi:hypothetical protein
MSQHTDAPANAEAAESGEQSSLNDESSGDEPTQAEIMESIRRGEVSSGHLSRCGS